MGICSYISQLDGVSPVTMWIQHCRREHAALISDTRLVAQSQSRIMFISKGSFVEFSGALLGCGSKESLSFGSDSSRVLIIVSRPG